MDNNKVAYYCDKCTDSKTIVYGTPTGDHKCSKCGGDCIPLSLTLNEMVRIYPKYNADLVLAMDKLKKDNIIDFQLKFNELINSTPQPQSQSTANIPKCPTCGSTNIKKISGAKRWVGTGLFGLASSDLGKTMQCNSCGYKF